MNQEAFDFHLETPRHKAVWSSLKTGFNNTCTWVMENPGEVILFAVGICLIDMENSLDAIEEYEEIQTAIDLYELNGGV